MKVTATELPEIRLVEGRVARDSRGQFREFFVAETYAAAGISGPFVQDNVSWSRRGVLRGLHLQHPNDQAKLVGVVQGEVYDVAVDVRPNSPTYRRWVGERLSAENGRQLYVPAGFAHGFLALADETIVVYKCTAPYQPESEIVVRWDDPAIGIDWPSRPANLSERDGQAPLLSAIDPLRLPRR